ncbi:MAG: substrate-binding domain-containing protein [Eubacteriales bacterium]|nr:substrate-binding domain-containing protein [Eubacteriales bacterium]
MKKIKKWVYILLAVCIAAAGIAGFWLWKQKKENQMYSLIYIPKTADGTNDFWTSLISGARMAAKEYHASLEVLAPDREQDVERQNELLAEAIEKQPDAILISPSSFTASTELLETAKKKGIRITFVDSYIEEDIQDLTVATDNLEAGRKLGEYASGFLEDDSKIAVVCHVQGVSTAVERERGFREGLGAKAENIVEVVYCDSIFDKAYALTEELMEKYPDLEMIAGLNEYSSVGAARAVKDANAQDRIKVVGIDSSQEAVQLMEQGIFRGFVVQKAFKMGYVGVRETVRMLNGEDVEKDIDSGSELVTPENMYTSEIEKLLFPFNNVSQTETEQ